MRTFSWSLCLVAFFAFQLNAGQGNLGAIYRHSARPAVPRFRCRVTITNTETGVKWTARPAAPAITGARASWTYRLEAQKQGSKQK